MPATTTRTDSHPERGLPDQDWDYELSHLKALTTHRGTSFISLKAARSYRRSIGGWARLHSALLPIELEMIEGQSSREALEEHLERINACCARLYQADKQQKAQREADRLDRRRRKEEAKEEYREWLQGLPLGGADAYKEDSGRWIYPGGGRDNPGHAREMSVTRWLHQKAHKHYPDEARNVAAEIRDKYDLHSGTMLV